MKELLNFLKRALSAQDEISSKRLSGFLGWLVCLFCVIYAVFLARESPRIVDTLFIMSSALLGLDSITTIFKK